MSDSCRFGRAAHLVRHQMEASLPLPSCLSPRLLKCPLLLSFPLPPGSSYLRYCSLSHAILDPVHSHNEGRLYPTRTELTNIATTPTPKRPTLFCPSWLPSTRKVSKFPIRARAADLHPYVHYTSPPSTPTLPSSFFVPLISIDLSDFFPYPFHSILSYCQVPALGGKHTSNADGSRSTPISPSSSPSSTHRQA